MIWLVAVLQRIDSDRRVHIEARNQLKLAVAEMSGICDVHIPQAPAPQYEIVEDEAAFAHYFGKLGWFWAHEHRALSVETNGTRDLMLRLMHRCDGVVHSTMFGTLSHEQLKSAVLSFFDGWNPPTTQVME